MAFDILLNSSLTILGVGLIIKMIQWLSYKTGIRAENESMLQRLAAALKGVLSTVFSLRFFNLPQTFVLDILFLRRTFKQDLLRWIMHMLIFWGFILLFFMHALESIVSDNLFSYYYSTINPFMFLRDLFGAMVLVGLLIAVFRRFFMKIQRMTSNAQDIYAILIVGIIIVSGFGLEGTKIISYNEFLNMEDEFAALDYEEDIFALESYWVKNYGLASPNNISNVSEEVLALGEEIHNDTCIDCHTKPTAAFGGYAVSRAFKPFAGILEFIGAVNIFYWIHILACFIGLAILPFTKMFHIVTTPLSLFTSAVMKRENASPLNIATRQAIELDACVHCTTCSSNCSVAPAFDILGNENIMPSERMMALRRFSTKQKISSQDFLAIQEGICLCSSCERCTVVCPAGINLKELWYDVREHFIRNGSIVTPLVLTPYSYNRAYSRDEFESPLQDSPAREAKSFIGRKYNKGKFVERDKPLPLIPDKDQPDKKDMGLTQDTFAYCFSCENCTNICPVVMNYEKPEEALDMLPHQIMRSLGLGLTDLVLGANMLWDCVTCYQCQENCPQNVKVTDIFFELKNQISKECFKNHENES
ncbi:MAG: 4Fe-4S dicluster domain-containing protein [Desulfobacteraceae bacterium]|nr:4Fe-4S dicluster domain-containing protein [Desulfobacteraceae bacterium]